MRHKADMLRWGEVKGHFVLVKKEECLIGIQQMATSSGTFVGENDNRKLERIQVRALRAVCCDNSSSYSDLLELKWPINTL